MSGRYGRENCPHDWVPREDGYEEYCTAAVCSECGAFGCLHDVEESEGRNVTYKGFMSRKPLRGDANINGRWENSYVEKARKAKELKEAMLFINPQDAIRI